MKQLLAFILACIITISCNEKSSLVKTDLQTANIKGSVIQITESFHKVGEACCPAGDKTDCSRMVTIFDENGYTIKSAKIGVNGDTMSISRFNYNDSGECTGIQNFSGNSLLTREENSIEKGLVSAAKIFDAGGNPLNAYQFEYEKGHLTRIATYDNTGKLLNTYENKYEKGKLETKTSRDAEGKIISITRNRCNNNGDVIEEKVIHPKDNSEYTLLYEYEYDSKGNWIKRTKIYNDDIIKITLRDIRYFGGETVSL